MNFLFFASGSQKIFSRMGYYRDQDGILRRYLRERSYWKKHLDRTKSFIEKSAANKSKNKVAILGSGWLLDVPVEYLCNNFNEVWLFDIKHPVQIKKRLKEFRNIHYTETDLSGYAISVYNEVNRARASSGNLELNLLKPSFDFDLSLFDLVVSCNMLNQLDIILIDYALSKLKLSGQDTIKLRTQIQDTHINLLPPDKSILITDVKELQVDKNDIAQNQIQLMYTSKLPEPLEKWHWHFDNHFTYNDRYKTWFEVNAFIL